jgi:glycosyltransferase involved in cell wall biosynthesis
MLISIIILTHNEEANLPMTLVSLESLNADIFIVDSGSTDNTVSIAEKAGCYVVNRQWKTYSEQLNWAIENLPIKTQWVMRLDADERLTPELVKEIIQVLPNSSTDVSGYQIKRRVYFMHRWIRHGGYYPTWLLRIWRNGIGHCEERAMDEHIILSQGQVVNLCNDIVDENNKGLTFWVNKHNSYADREVRDLLNLDFVGDKLLADNIWMHQANRKRWMKTNLYAVMPLFLRSTVYFLFRYIVLLGFLDGIEGLIFHFLQGYWYRFLVDAKIHEFRMNYQINPRK